MFLLRTFGALELTTESGEPVAGAAAQRKPLLILALAALAPGGIPRERLLRALWPGVDRSRARATLKQHLYALRRATGNPRLVTGSPRLRVAADTVRVDALAFVEHVEHGRLHAAAELLQGEILEEITAARGELLGELIDEIRASYAPRVMLVRKAVAAQRSASTSLAHAGAIAPVCAERELTAERELAAAVRRFTRGMVTLPSDAVEASHRTASSSHDLLEALHAAERSDLPPERIDHLLAEAVSVWRRSELVRQMIAVPLGEPGSMETLEWLLEGGLRTNDPVGRALETHLLESPFAAQLRTRASWEVAHVLQLLAGPAAKSPRLLLLGPRGGRTLATILPVLQHAGTWVVVSDVDDDALSLARLRLAPLGEHLMTFSGDTFSRLGEIAATGPFDLILAGTVLDSLAARHATWLTEKLVRSLAPGGVLCLSSLTAGDSSGAWLRHVVRWSITERDRDDVVMLTGDVAGECDLDLERGPAGHAWLVTLSSRVPEDRQSGRAAA
ncbi:MAG TPA: hypothetical protein VGL65_01285 [Gemmatimonadales bacterium]